MSTKKRLVFDLETNGLLPQCNRIWMLVTKDPDSGESLSFTDSVDELGALDGDLQDGLRLLETADTLIGHNIIGFDLLVLEQLLDWRPDNNQTVIDTWLMSLFLRYKRKHRHGLEGWGQHLGYPKLDFDEWDKPSKQMLTYCRRDVNVNVKVWDELMKEFTKMKARWPLIQHGLLTEMEFARIEAGIRSNGWRFDHEGAEALEQELSRKCEQMEEILDLHIGLVCLSKDKRDKETLPRFTKAGKYAVATARWFGVSVDDGLRGRRSLLTEGAGYCRVEFVQGHASSDRHLKAWLYTIGWVPDDWNVERINGKFIQKSPKLTDTSLAKLGDLGDLLIQYNTLSSRLGILRGWLKAVEYDGRLHGRMWTIGTPTFRCRHEVVANLPKVGTAYGKEMRSLLLPNEGEVIIGADSSGNQMRGFCHYVDNDEYTAEVIDGDIHTKNANVLRPFMLSLAHDTSDWSTKATVNHDARENRAKRFLYAYLFGMGAGKAGELVNGSKDSDLGRRAMDAFESSIPGLQELRSRLEKEWLTTKQRFGDEWAHIRGLDGRILFVSTKHTLLTAILQSVEGMTCKAAAVWLRNRLYKEKIPHTFLLHYHDELAISVPPQYADRATKLAAAAFRIAPKQFGINIMNGEAKQGATYAEVH